MKKFVWKRLFALSLCVILLVGLIPSGRAKGANAVEIITASKSDSTLETLAETLYYEIEKLPATGALRNAKVSISSFSQSADGSKELKNLKGKHYLIREEGDSLYVVDGSWTGTDGTLPMKKVTAYNSDMYYISSGLNNSMAFSFYYRGLASNGMPAYVLRFNNGKNLAVGSRYTGTYTNLYNVKADTTSTLSTAPQVRFDHPAGVTWIRISNVSGTHGLRQATDLSGLRWKDNSAGDNDYGGNVLYLYRPWSTKDIITVIHNMQGYLETPGLYDPSVYSQFLTCLQDSIALFKKYNPIPTAQIGAYEYVQESIDQAISDLNSYASRLVIVSNGTVEQEAAALRLQLQTLPADGQNLNGRFRLVPFSQSADGSKDIINLKGKHYLVLGEGGNHYVVNANWTDGNGELPLKLVTVDDTNSYSVITDGAVPSMAFTFSYRGVASNGMPSYVLRFHNSTYLGVGTKYSNWNNLYYVKQESASTLSAAPQIRLDHPSGVNWVRISNVSGTHGLRQATDLSCMRWKDNSAGDNDYAGNALFLYRIWSTKSLLTAIKDMSGYLDTPEFFDEEVFRKFLTCMKESIALFEKYNVSPTSMIQAYDFIQDTLDQKEAELRAFASQLSFQVSAPSSASLNTTTKIHQLPLACCYVIQTRGGKIIIIDGGWQENNTEGKYLFSYLQKITGDSTPHIDAWFITHAHADHHGCVPTFADLYKDQVTIDAFYFHYPTYEQISKYLVEAGVEGTWGAADWLPSWIIPKFKNAEGGPTKCITVNTEHSGLCDNSFDFDEVHIDILLTFEDVVWAAENVTGTYSGTSENAGRVFSNLTFKQLLSDNMNETSTVFRATVGGKSILFTGDINYIGGYMLNKFHAAHASNSSSYYSIKSDYVQVSHHGHYGLPKNTYYTIDADVAMWPVNYDEWNDNDYQNLICTKQWFNDMGAKSYPAYQGPHIFEFPVVRSEGAITVPSALKEYIFDAEYYSAKYPDLAKLYGTDENKLYYHFLNYGIEEGRCASPFFDVTFYANQNGQHLSDTFKGNYIAAFEDFLSKYKTTTLMKLSENFDPTVYKALHTELHNQGIRSNFSLLKHYVANGYPKGEIASTTFLCEDRTMTYHEDCTVTQPVAATCTTAGKTAGIKCNTCGLVLSRSETVPVTGHSEVVDRGTPATCTTAGLSDGAHCSVCNTVTREQTELPPLDHNIVDGACTVCGERYTGTLLDFTPNSPELDYSWTVLKCCEVPTFDTEGSGYMTGKLSASGGETRTDIYIGMLAVNNPDNLNHKIRTADEVFQLRYKLDLDIEIPAENRTKFYLKTGAVAQSAGYSETYQVATTQEVKDEEGYTVVTVQVPENLVGQIIETIRIDLLDYIGYVALEGSYSIDYIYMGPGCTAPNAAHSIITIPGKAPTCTEPGLTDEVYCSLCDEILATQEEIPALGHTVVTQEAVPPTCTNSGLTEGKYCTLCKEVFLAQEVLPRLGHSYSYTELDPQTHQTLCVNCGQSKTNSHSYENGLCVCGAVEIKEPIEDSSLKLSHSLNLASDISVNFVVLKTMLADFDLSTVYVEAEIDMYEGNEKTGTQTLRLEPVDTGYYYYFTLKGLTAVQMNNRISSVLYGTKNGQPYCSPVDDYAIADYAYFQLNKTNTTEKLRILCADLLRYGAKAQIYKNYRTDFLADRLMTDAHRSYLSDTESVTFGNVNEDLKDLENAPVVWAGKTLNLESKVCLKFVFKTSGYTGELSSLSLRVSYEDRNGKTKTLILTEPEVYSQAAQMYSFTVDALLAAELRSVVSVQIYAEETPVSTTLRYSPDTYGNGKTGALGELCKALFAYSDSAKGYFVG